MDGRLKGRYGYVVDDKDLHWSELKPKIWYKKGITNNEAEYRALIKCLESLPIETEVTILSDSMLVVNQFNKLWKIREKHMKDLYAMAKSVFLVKRLKVTLNWIPRKYNKMGKILEEDLKNV